MNENGNESIPFEVEDVEAHLRMSIDGPDEDDDVEGHVQPPRGDDTDHIHSIMRY